MTPDTSHTIATPDGLRRQSPPGRTDRFRPVRLGPSDVVAERKPDGTIYLRSPHPLGEYPVRLTDRLEFWAKHAPDRLFLAQRTAGGGWRSLTYADTLAQVRRIAAALLERPLSRERPIAVLSGNDIEHALIELAAIYVGIPYAPISPAYSLVSTDYGKLRYIADLLTPGLVFAADGDAFARAIEAVLPRDVEIVTTHGSVSNRRVTPFSALLKGEPGAAVDAANAAVGPDTIAKILFTSGSTGMPKGVINTQRMWCANQKMIATMLAFFHDEPPVIVDWAPWHHTAGGNHDFGLIIFNGGTFYIDEGKPLPGAIEETVRNLREVAPTWYFNVPKGYEALLPYLRADKALRETFFSRLKLMFYAGAGASQRLLDEMQDLAGETCGERVLFLTSLGSTETAPFAVMRTWDTDRAGNVGLPAPGLELKLVPAEGKYEGRVRGPNVTPGYWREAALTAAAFDEEGFYKLGDAFTFADPSDPRQGLIFEGRLAEDFKLATGTWVNVGPLRTAFLDHFAPYIRDVVVAGADRDYLAALVFPELEACRRLAGGVPADAAAEAVLLHPAVSAELHHRLTALARKSTGSSTRIKRAILLDRPPSLDVGEITDKGSINQRAVLKARADLVEEVYRDPPSPRILAVE